jgi:integrase/recombinase XerD
MLHRKPVVSVFVRHAGTCQYEGKEFYRGCDCPKYLRYSAGGKQHRLAAGTRSWAVAEEKAVERQAQLDAGQSGTPVATAVQPTIEAYIQTYVLSKVGEDRSNETVRKLKFQLGQFEKFMASRSKFYPTDITTKDLIEYRAKWSSWKSNVTKQRGQVNLKGFIHFCCSKAVADELLKPFKAIKLTAEDEIRKAPRPFSEEELQHLVAQIPTVFPDARKASRLTALIHCMASTGLAIRDAVQLERESLTNGWLTIKRQKTKKPVKQKLEPGLHQELMSVLNGNPRYVFFSGTNLPNSEVGCWQTDLRKLMKAAGCYFKGNLSHRFRDTFVDWHLGQGSGLNEIAAMLGDTVTVVESHYDDLFSKRMAERLAKVPMRVW